MTTVAAGVEGGSIGDSRIVMSDFLGESLNVLDDSGLHHLIVKDPVGLRTILEEGASPTEIEEVITGHIAENVTFLDDDVELETGNHTSTPAKMWVLLMVRGKLLQSRASREATEGGCFRKRIWESRRKCCIADWNWGSQWRDVVPQ